MVRAEEQSVRSARVVYALNQQISQLQDELARSNLKMLPAAKKVCYGYWDLSSESN
jgi:hypothetical protein